MDTPLVETAFKIQMSECPSSTFEKSSSRNSDTDWRRHLGQINEAPIKFHWKRKILQRVEEELEMTETSASLHGSREQISETGWSCRICKRGNFSRRFTRDRHELTHRSTETHYDCPMCNSKLKRADYLLKHIARHHSGTKKYKCRFCEKTLRSEKTITNHEMRNHADRFFSNKQ